MRDSERDAEARRKAEAVLTQRKKQEDEILQQRAKEREAVSEKVARLRELRLAKEAAEAASKPKTQATAKWRKSGMRNPWALKVEAAPHVHGLQQLR